MTIVGDVTTWNINLTTLKSSFSIIIIIRPVNLHMKQESTSTAPRLTRQVYFLQTSTKRTRRRKARRKRKFPSWPSEKIPTVRRVPFVARNSRSSTPRTSTPNVTMEAFGISATPSCPMGQTTTRSACRFQCY